MHRSSSYYLQSSSSSVSPLVATGAVAAAPGPSSTAVGVMDVDQLPTYDPRSDVAKKEALDASRADLARALVHLVPVVVLVCGLLLWSLSNTDFPAVLVEKGDGRTMVAQVRIVPQNSGSAASSWKGSVSMSATEDSDPILDKAHGRTKRRLLLRSEIERGKQFKPCVHALHGQ